jgi:hypothetical protein
VDGWSLQVIWGNPALSSGNHPGSLPGAAEPARRFHLSRSGQQAEGVRMHFSWKRWWRVLIAALTALALSVVLAGPAVAVEPGESDEYIQENVGNQELDLRGTLGEARNTQGDLLQVWRGADNNNVWMSLDNGNPFTLGTTATYSSPTVVPYGQSSFMVLHVGTNGFIYYAIVNTDYSWTPWTWVPYQTTNMAVSVTQLGENSNQLYMVYHSSGSDNRVWGTYYDGYGWQGAQQLAEGTSPSAPSVTYNPGSGLWAVARGMDNRIWMSYSNSNGRQWNDWTPQGGGDTTLSPTIAASGETNQMLVTYVDSNTFRPVYQTYSQWGAPTNDPWSPDITNWQTIYSVGVSVVGAVMYALFTGLNGGGYYKQLYSS